MTSITLPVSQEALPPCPFCGGEPIAENFVIEAQVRCLECGAKVVRKHGQYDDSGYEAAIEAWDTRDTSLRNAILEEAAGVVDKERELRGAHMEAAKAAGLKKEARDFQTMVIAHCQAAASIRQLRERGA